MSEHKDAGPRLLILNVGQAEALYSAMCALNNVGAFMPTALIPMGPDHLIGVCQHPLGGIEIAGRARSEAYASQHDFASAYGLNPDALRRGH